MKYGLKNYKKKKKFIKNGLFILVLFFVLAVLGTVVYAGNLTPPSITPSASFYTLSDIYNLITNNTTATEGGHDFTFSDSLTSTGHTLTDIYGALTSLVSADKVKLGTTYLGTAGSLVPSGGTATVASVLTGKTFFGDSQTDWNLQTGTMPDNTGHADFSPGVNSVSIPTGFYDGVTKISGDVNLVTGNIKNGITIFGVSGESSVVDTSDATAGTGDILLNKTGYVNGALITGTYDTTNLTNALVKLGTTYGVSSTGSLVPSGGTAITANVCSGSTFFGASQADWNLQTGNLNPSAGTILSGTTICGVSGTVVPTPTYGDNDPSQVLDTAANPGTFDPNTISTYDTSNLSVGTVKNGTAFGDSLSLIGEYPSVTYPLSGETGSGDATAGNVLSGLKTWTSAGSLLTGTMTDNTGHADFTPAVTSVAIPTGFYDGVTKISGDANLISANILSGKTIFGVAGSLTAGYTYGDTSQNYVLGTAASPGIALKNLWNGTSGSFTGGSQTDGGADDYNNGGSPSTGRYAMSWTQCTSGNTYCGTGDSGAGYKDNSTGLVFSMPCNGVGCSSLSNTTPITYSWDSSASNNNSLTASQLCSSHSGWSLPTQKQLMQAYIDGSYGNLESAGVYRHYWSATTYSNSTTSAWYVDLSYGNTNLNTKTTTLNVRCVR